MVLRDLLGMSKPKAGKDSWSRPRGAASCSKSRSATDSHNALLRHAGFRSVPLTVDTNDLDLVRPAVSSIVLQILKSSKLWRKLNQSCALSAG